MRVVERLLGLFCVTAVVLWQGLGRGQPAAAAPLTEADVQKLLELGLDSQAIISSIHENGIEFRTDSRILDRFKTAGASKEVLDALGKARSGPATQPAQTPARAALTYADVIRLLNLRISEDVILRRLADSNSTFTLDAKQITELKSRGATDRLVSAMQPSASAPGRMPWQNTVVVADCSKRMLEKTTDGVPRLEAVRQMLGNLVQGASADSHMAIVLFGLNRGTDNKEGAGAARVLFPLTKMTDAAKTDLIIQFAMLGPGGDDAPVAAALEMAGKELAKGDGKGAILLITGGADTSQADPAAVAANLKKDPKCAGIAVFGLHLSPEHQTAMKKVAGAAGDFYNFESVQQLAAASGPKPASTVVRGQAPPSGTAGRRAVRIASPGGLQLPKLAKIAVVKDNDYRPDSQYYKPFLEAAAYGEEFRLPTADKYDIYWVPAEGVPVLMVKGFAIADRRVVEVKPEAYLGIVRVTGTGQAAPKLLAVTTVDDYNPASPYFKPVQTGTKFGQDMVVPAGKYDVWVQPRSGAPQMLEGKLDVKPGQVMVIE